jgi:hypothetical protein
VSRVSAVSGALCTDFVMVLVVSRVGRRLGRRALLTRWCVWILVASEAALKAVYLLVFSSDLGFEFFDALLHRLQSLEKFYLDGSDGLTSATSHRVCSEKSTVGT